MGRSWTCWHSSNILVIIRARWIQTFINSNIIKPKNIRLRFKTFMPIHVNKQDNKITTVVNKPNKPKRVHVLRWIFKSTPSSSNNKTKLKLQQIWFIRFKKFIKRTWLKQPSLTTNIKLLWNRLLRGIVFTRNIVVLWQQNLILITYWK